MNDYEQRGYWDDWDDAIASADQQRQQAIDLLRKSKLGWVLVVELPPEHPDDNALSANCMGTVRFMKHVRKSFNEAMEDIDDDLEEAA